MRHSQKTASAQNASAEFPAIDATGKASSLLSQLAASDESQIAKKTVDAFAQTAGPNPKTELSASLEMLERSRVIDTSPGSDVSVSGLTTGATVRSQGSTMRVPAT